MTLVGTLPADDRAQEQGNNDPQQNGSEGQACGNAEQTGKGIFYNGEN